MTHFQIKVSANYDIIRLPKVSIFLENNSSPSTIRVLRFNPGRPILWLAQFESQFRNPRTTQIPQNSLFTATCPLVSYVPPPIRHEFFKTLLFSFTPSSSSSKTALNKKKPFGHQSTKIASLGSKLTFNVSARKFFEMVAPNATLHSLSG